MDVEHGQYGRTYSNEETTGVIDRLVRARTVKAETADVRSFEDARAGVETGPVFIDCASGW